MTRVTWGPRAAYARHLRLAACTCRRPEAGTCQWCVKADMLLRVWAAAAYPVKRARTLSAPSRASSTTPSA